MKTFKNLCAAGALALATLLPASGHAQLVLDEGFDNILMLRGWELINNSTPVGQSWFQGNPGVFPAQAGVGDAYIAANFQSAAGGEGLIDNWLLTPALTLIGPTTLTFFTRGGTTVGFNDTLEVRFGAGGATDTAGFDMLLATIGGTASYPGAWEQFSLSLPYVGIGRFAFRYTGNAELANYIGIDTVSVLSVPEPSAYLMLGAGLFAFTMLRRRKT